MDFTKRIAGMRAPRDTARIDPLLDCYMGTGFELEVALLRIVAEVVPERPLDIDRMGIMPFDQIAVIAIHGANESGQGRADTGGQAAAKRRRLGGEFDRQVLGRSETRRPFANFHRLHQINGFTAIFDHLDVRFRVRPKN